MNHHFKEKLLNQGYLESIQGDMEYRLEVHANKFVSAETLEERIHIMKNHILICKTVNKWIDEFWSDYIKVVKELKSLEDEKNQRLQD